MSRYLKFTTNDRVPQTDGDTGFVGVNCKIDAALLKTTLVSSAINKRFLRGTAATRQGMVTPPALNALHSEVTTTRTTAYAGKSLTSGALTVVETNVTPSTSWTLESAVGTLNARKITTTATGTGGTSGTLTVERTALATTGTGILTYDVVAASSQTYSQTDTWTVTNQSSTGTTFPNLVSTSASIHNPFPGTITCQITSGQDDDTYVQAFNADGTSIAIPLGPYVRGVDHACKGWLYGDYAQRDSVSFSVPQGGWIVLQSWDAVSGKEGGKDSILWSGTVNIPASEKTWTAAQFIAAGMTLPADCEATITNVETIWATFTGTEYTAGASIPAWAQLDQTVSSTSVGMSETVYGVGIYSDPSGTEWVLFAVSDGVYRCRWDQTPQKIGTFDGARIAQACELVQAFDKVMLFRATKAQSEAQDESDDDDVDDADDLRPLEWDGQLDGLFRPISKSTSGTGINPIPNSYTGVNVQNRLLVPTKRDAIGISDVLDYTRYDSILSQFRVNSGTDEVIMRIFPFTDSSILVFKSNSVWQISNLTGTWSENAVQSVLNPTVGCIARNSVAAVGADVFFLSRTGVYRVLQIIAGRLQTSPVPVSDPIEPIIARINWAAAENAQAAVFGQYYCLAVPLDGSSVNNVILRYNTVSDNWEGYDQVEFEWSISRLIVTDYMGEKRLMAVDLSDKRVYVLDEGKSDVVGQVEYAVADLLETRGYTLDQPVEVKQFKQVVLAMASWAPRYTVTAITDGVAEEMVLRDAVTRARERYAIFGREDYDTSNANDDQLAPGREDYALIPDGVYCGSGLRLDLAQEFIDPMPLRAAGRYVAFRVENNQGSCDLRSVQVYGLEAQTTKEAQ
ncbi:MAG: hypothetical protein ACFUZC_05010 [Chthoniobacteraceae bacterium]